MSIIRILPDEISNRIAAGEVIERPASVLKELLENSIDALARSMSVVIEGAGSRLVSVSDDGIGMDQDDALTCLEPHATSKIASADDLNIIHTLGFRGEALPSIASVSRMRIRTRRSHDLQGTEVVCEGGFLRSSDPVGCAPGTEISVRDLFYNMPARKKFLFSDSTEEKHIFDCFIAIALGRADASFSLKIDGKIVQMSPGAGDLRPRIRDFFGKSAEENLIGLDSSSDGISVHGFVAKHGFTRPSRRDQRIYVNKRPVEAQCVFSGIKDAYSGLVQDGRYPFVILFIEMDPSRVDVNVHPAKRELRFREPRLVTSLISKAISETLRNSQTPTVFIQSQIPLRSALAAATVVHHPKAEPNPELPHLSKKLLSPILPPPLSSFAKNAGTPAHEAKAPAANIEDKQLAVQDSATKIQSEASCGAFSDQFDLEILGFSGATYIVCSSESGIVILDQHAAHERILFEEILRNSKLESPASQKLLLPVVVELHPSEAAFLKKNAGAFDSLGFDIEPYGNDSFAINAIPQALRQENVAGMMEDMLSDLFEQIKSAEGLSSAQIAKAACSHAVKAKEKLSLEEARALLTRLSLCELPFSCPHGRPTVIHVSFRELERRFGRRG